MGWLDNPIHFILWHPPYHFTDEQTKDKISTTQIKLLDSPGGTVQLPVNTASSTGKFAIHPHFLVKMVVGILILKTKKVDKWFHPFSYPEILSLLLVYQRQSMQMHNCLQNTFWLTQYPNNKPCYKACLHLSPNMDHCIGKKVPYQYNIQLVW